MVARRGSLPADVDDGGGAPTCLRHARLGPDRIELSTKVAFEYDRPTLRPASFAVLDDVAALLLAHPAIVVESQGHGLDEEYRDLRLSDRRARTVMDFLVTRGVPARQLESHGYGDTVPRVPWTAQDTRLRNIRIELHLRSPPPAPPSPP